MNTNPKEDEMFSIRPSKKGHHRIERRFSLITRKEPARTVGRLLVFPKACKCSMDIRASR
jgi:hypothetical protein